MIDIVKESAQNISRCLSGRLVAFAAMGALLAGCAHQSRSDAMSVPDALPDNWTAPSPVYKRPYKQADAPLTGNSRVTSLWSSSPQSLFGDRRASSSGDILTVLIEIDDEAEMKNTVAHSRSSNQGFNVNALFGIPQLINPALPNGASLSPAVNMDRGSAMTGSGNIKREEKLTLRLAARVINVMPNGYLRLAGQQSIMVNNEVRYLQVTGLARTQDVSRQNTITYDKIAEARIFYGGQGQVSDDLAPRGGEKLMRKIVPF